MGTGTARLHDVVRTWLRRQLGTASLAELDGALVAGYRARCRGTWHAVPDDGYALQHLPSHLRTANEAAWRELLLDPRWIARKLTALGTTALVADYEPVVEDELRLIGDALRLFHGTRRPASAHLKGHAGQCGGGDARRPAGGLGLVGTLKVWDLVGGEIRATLVADHPVSSVAAVSDRLFVAGDADGTVHVLELVESQTVPS